MQKNKKQTKKKPNKKKPYKKKNNKKKHKKNFVARIKVILIASLSGKCNNAWEFCTYHCNGLSNLQIV